MLAKNSSKMRNPSPNHATTSMIPAPAAGMDGLTNMAEQTPADAVSMINLIPAPRGSTTRDGSRQWCTGLSGPVKTVIPYIGSVPAKDRLFVAVGDPTLGGGGIVDCTTSMFNPPTVAVFTLPAFPGPYGSQGIGVWQTFVNTAGAYFCLYTDEENGYYVYTESTGLWARITLGGGATQISGVDPATFVSVLVWKSRVWFVQKDTGFAWYTAVGALYGAVTAFNFGNKFKHGGSLRAQYNWTVDGGEGVDDYLISISGGGDVIVYKGTDPAAAATFAQTGQYFIGPPPAGRRIAGTFGGDLYLLSSFGVIALIQLLSGQLVGETTNLVTRRISPMINTDMRLYQNQQGWEIRYLPTQNLLMITVPKQEGFDYRQYVQHLDTRGWAFYRDFPAFTGDTWHGLYYFGGNEIFEGAAVLYVHTGDLDRADLDDAADGDNIDWSMLTSFQDYQEPAANRVAQLIRATFIAAASPSYVAVAKYDYDMSEPLEVAFQAPPVSGSLWDVALWDVGLWGGDVATVNPLRGAGGIGRSMAIYLRGNSATKTMLVRFDATTISGNVL